MRLWLKLVLVFVVVAIAVAAVLVVRSLFFSTSAAGPECVVRHDPSLSVAEESTVDLGSASQTVADISLSAVQLQHASTINAVGLQKEIPVWGRVIAVATALQESSLRNVSSGDRDSVGLFQQRPSQGWGTIAQISDPIYSAGIFYDRLLEVPDWADLPLTEAAQAVQYSGHPEAYAKWENESSQLVSALSGLWGGVALTCRDGATASTADTPERATPAGFEGGTATLTALVSAADAELGAITPVELADDGRTAVVSIAVPQLSADQAALTLAYWLLAHAASGQLDSVTVESSRWDGSNSWETIDPGLPSGQVRFTVMEPNSAS